eukprot:753161-Hanusia_phi.AAC.2
MPWPGIRVTESPVGLDDLAGQNSLTLSDSDKPLSCRFRRGARQWRDPPQCGEKPLIQPMSRAQWRIRQEQRMRTRRG